MKCKVFKFGGASLQNAERIRNVADILSKHKGEKILIVVSAIGKTTNALEEIVEAYFGNNNAMDLLQSLKSNKMQLIEDLFEADHSIQNAVNDIFVEVEWVLEDEIKDSYDYVYDQIVSIGELISSKIVFAFLKELGSSIEYLDARDCVITDETYRESNVIWDKTEKNTRHHVENAFEKNDWVITQGFIGSTEHNQTTTLGREGSDYTASIFSFALNAERMCIWKDVPGVLSADPRYFENVIKIDRLSYREAVEMTYYGAKVIHPKTIKPIQNKNIPLYVKSFLNPSEEGTLIAEEFVPNYPPVIVVEPNQALLHISPKDFSFVAESHLSHLFDLFNKYRIKVKMMRNTAISFTICTHAIRERLDQLMLDLNHDFKVISDQGLELITIRHFNDQVVEEMSRGRIVLFEERLRDTVQMVVKTIPSVRRKEP